MNSFEKTLKMFILRKAADSRTNYILHRAIDVVFSKKLFAKCSWSGRGKKISLKELNNVLELFKDLDNLEDEEVETFFVKKKP